jgi:hypothetical protein
MTVELSVFVAILVVGLGYALLPQIFSLGEHDVEPPVEQRRIRKLREKKQKWIQGILDLDTEWELGNLEEQEYRTLRTKYKRKATEVLGELQQLTEEIETGDEQEDLDQSIEVSIEEKKKQLSNEH